MQRWLQVKTYLCRDLGNWDFTHKALLDGWHIKYHAITVHHNHVLLVQILWARYPEQEHRDLD